mmetsp:Transcript_5457/g.21576  ORF Transcript_5457/g.21576 Transcript_5457/m.21576 type:complete len:243 (+) Transcript_5457:1016-1744(+)
MRFRLAKRKDLFTAVCTSWPFATPNPTAPFRFPATVSARKRRTLPPGMTFVTWSTLMRVSIHGPLCSPNFASQRSSSCSAGSSSSPRPRCLIKVCILSSTVIAFSLISLISASVGLRPNICSRSRRMTSAYSFDVMSGSAICSFRLTLRLDILSKRSFSFWSFRIRSLSWLSRHFASALAYSLWRSSSSGSSAPPWAALLRRSRKSMSLSSSSNRDESPPSTPSSPARFPASELEAAARSLR